MVNLFDCDCRNPHQQTRCKFATSFATEFCIRKPVPKCRAN